MSRFAFFFAGVAFGFSAVKGVFDADYPAALFLFGIGLFLSAMAVKLMTFEGDR